MQRVIELGRVSRERRTIGLKTPLRTLVVIHHDNQYLEDIKSLESYITEELNVRDLVLTSDEAKYNVQYSVTADWPVLGKKLKKDMARVKKALPTLTSEQVQSYLIDKKILVDGIPLEEGDLVVRRSVKEDEASKKLEINTDGALLTILDSEIYPELAQEGLAREIVNRVQRLRKKAGLQPTDDVKMEYQVVSDPENLGLADVMVSHTATFEKVLRRPVEKREEGATGELIAEEEQEIQQAILLLRLVKL
jgi:isoleucyl-tRNA synthetase